MVQLFGREMSRAQIAASAGALSQFAGVRLVTLGDGLERGIRLLEFRSGSGLRFTVLVDRAMDIADLDHKGRSVGWHSPTGFRSAALHSPEAEDGFSWTRSFSGFLATCGLDHILGPQRVSTQSYNYPGHQSTQHGLHGRISTIPARLTGYGETWQDERCVLWAEGIVVQSKLFGENLHLHRRIEVDLGGDEIRLTDRVVNAGFLTTPHMMFYHVNIGHPVLDDGARYLAPIRDVLWAAHSGARYRAQGVGYQTAPAPSNGFVEQVWQHDMAADADGQVPVALVNDRLGLGIEIRTRKDQMPCAYQWQYFQSGAYVMGLEPSTHHVLGNQAARDRGEMIWLGPQDSRSYETRFRILDGAGAIAASESAIRAIGGQPTDDFPEPSGQFPALTGR